MVANASSSPFSANSPSNLMSSVIICTIHLHGSPKVTGFFGQRKRWSVVSWSVVRGPWSRLQPHLQLLQNSVRQSDRRHIDGVLPRPAVGPVNLPGSAVALASSEILSPQMGEH